MTDSLLPDAIPDAADVSVPVCFVGDDVASRQCPRCGRWFCLRHGRGLCVQCRRPRGLAPSSLLYYGALALLVLSVGVAVYHIAAWQDDWAARLSYSVAKALEPAATATPSPAPTPPAQPSASLSATPSPGAAPGTAEGATPPAAGGATPTPAPSRSYTVQSGDTLLAVAIKFDTTVGALLQANGITNPAALQIGQELVIP